MLHQFGSQRHLSFRLDPQPDAAAQFDYQSGWRCRWRYFDPDERRRFGGAPARSPAAEGGVIEFVLAGKGRGGQAAALKGRQQLGATRCVRAPGPRGAMGSFHRPRLPRRASDQQGVAESPLTPFRLQFYFNGHAWLAHELRRAGIAFRMEDNAFVEIADWPAAQTLADGFSIQALHADLDALARQYVPFLKQFPSGYHWSLMQVEYSWDLSWQRAADLAPVYAEISRQAILTVKASDVAKFLGKRLSPEAELTSDFRTRIEGTRLKHSLGPASLKLYDKRGRVLRLECTANDVTFFSHYRKVEHRDGSATYQVAALKKSLYSLGDLAGLLRAACARYLAFLSALEDRTGGAVNLDRITEPARDEHHRSYRGFNFFATGDLTVLLAILRGEYHISGLSNRRLQRVLTGKNGGQISRILKRLRLHGLLKKIGHTYKYYVTALGQKLLVAALKLREHLILPALMITPKPTEIS